MKKIMLPVLGTVMLWSCQQKEKENVLYANEAYTLYADKVVQGNNEAKAISATHLVSNYRSPASENYSRRIAFKLSINEKDNELPVGQNHELIIGEEHASPIMKFGEKTNAPANDAPGFLPANYAYTFRFDVSDVLQQMEEKGYYETYDGSRIAKADFKGIYLAGGSLPMTWDFVNLEERELQLKPSGEPGIYTVTLNLNPYDEQAAAEKVWQQSVDLNERPQYQSEQPIVDALFNLSLEEAIKAIEPDSTFRTGAKWGGVWTRDISYSILLAFAYHQPDIAKISLRKKVKRGRIVQDTGSGGAWPVSSDRTTWVLAAWEIYKVTGDSSWLQEVYPIVKNTLDDDYKTLYDSATGLFCGESSFLDWREQTYPRWMNNADIYQSQNLGTNAVHYQAHRILSQMAKLMGEPHEQYDRIADGIKQGINKWLWLEDAGHFAQYRYGRLSSITSARFEALGEALCILFDIADADRATSIISRSPVTPFGTTCIYPQIPGIPPYHNNGIWPFVQSYWNLAAAKAGNEAALLHGLGAIYRAGALFVTNYENFVAQTGDFEGTEINSDRMLWSMAGNLAMVHRLFMGMHFDTDGMKLSPSIPESFGGKKSLLNFRYRHAILDIHINGFGKKMASVNMDGKALDKAFIPANITGRHTINIDMTNDGFSKDSIHLTQNHFTLETPSLTIGEDSSLQWTKLPLATGYNVYHNGRKINDIQTNSIAADKLAKGEYMVTAIDEKGYESFASQPVWIGMPAIIAEAEDAARPSAQKLSNFSGKGFVEINTNTNKKLVWHINVQEAGQYQIDIRYSNGSGPWNTDNKCAIRSLYVNDHYTGVMVMPQRGTNEWSDWGYSNNRQVQLQAGENTIMLQFDDWNNNMNVEVNRAMIDCIRLVKLSK